MPKVSHLVGSKPRPSQHQSPFPKGCGLTSEANDLCPWAAIIVWVALAKSLNSEAASPSLQNKGLPRYFM